MPSAETPSGKSGTKGSFAGITAGLQPAHHTPKAATMANFDSALSFGYGPPAGRTFPEYIAFNLRDVITDAFSASIATRSYILPPARQRSSLDSHNSMLTRQFEVRDLSITSKGQATWICCFAVFLLGRVWLYNRRLKSVALGGRKT